MSDNAKIACDFTPEAQVSEGTSEKAVTTRFRGYKSLLIKLVGKGPMEETKIDEIGKAEFGKRWAGVFASRDCCE